jgi:hypothetical protein
VRQTVSRLEKVMNGKFLPAGKIVISVRRDDQSPSRIRGMFQVVRRMARDTSWQSSTDFGIDGLLSVWTCKKATCRGDGSPLVLRDRFSGFSAISREFHISC